jgi:hypothetical protein
MQEVINNKNVRIGFFFALFFISFMNNCNTGQNTKAVRKLEKEVDSLRIELRALPTSKDFAKEIRIEGLKVEKRLIQSTDRKILDVQRQSDIEKEIINLEGK